MRVKKEVVKTQLIPVVLTFVVFVMLCVLLHGVIVFLNLFTSTDIYLKLRWGDVLVGLTIYLKTSVDFAILIGNLMARYDGWKNRIAIETGTAFGNALGTIIVLTIWNFFRNIEWLLVIMIVVAALVLFKLAEEGLEHAKVNAQSISPQFKSFVLWFEHKLRVFNGFLSPVLKYVIPNLSMKPKMNLTFVGLIVAAFTIPFVLGLDDFAGYVPLFSIVNVYGFAIGVFAGHMVLNMALFISPKKTIVAVKNPIVSLLGSLVFVGLGIWGLFEAYKILFIH